MFRRGTKPSTSFGYVPTRRGREESTLLEQSHLTAGQQHAPPAALQLTVAHSTWLLWRLWLVLVHGRSSGCYIAAFAAADGGSPCSTNILTNKLSEHATQQDAPAGA